MSFFPTDWASFIWGVFVGTIILFATGFLQKAGEHFFEFLRQKFSSEAEAASRTTDHDKSLFSQFKGLFSSSGIIKHYKEHDFLLPFEQSNLRPLYEVVENWGDESHNFANPLLQQSKSLFFEAAKALANEIVRYTVPDANGNVSVITRNMDPENLPAHVRQEAKAIDNKLPEFIRTHEELIELGNRLC